MSRVLSGGSARLPVFNKKLTVVAQGGYRWTVPSGVREVYISGVAAGSLGGGTAGHDVYLNWPAAPSRMPLIGVSENGVFAIATTVASVSSVIGIDTVTRRAQVLASISLNQGVPPAVANNGMVFFPGGGSSTGHVLRPGWASSAVSLASGIVGSSNQSYASIRPCEIDTSEVNVRAVFLGSNANTLMPYAGDLSNITGVAHTHTASGNASFTAVRHVNGRHVALSRSASATPRMQIFHIDSSPSVNMTVAGNWAKTAPAGDVTDLVMYDIAYGNGVYVVVTHNCKIYSATDISGPWTERTSGLPSSGGLQGIKFYNGRFVAGGSNGTNGVFTTSTDGINWTATNSGVGNNTFFHSMIQYDFIRNRWTVRNGNLGYLWSTDGSTWTMVDENSIRGLATTPFGLIYGSSSGVLFDLGGSAFTQDTAGGDFVCRRNGAEVLRLAGALSTLTGGSSSGIAYPAGEGSGGVGGRDTTAPPTGTGGAGGTTRNGGGGSIPFFELTADPGSWGIKIPGASAGSQNTSGCGGGASIYYGRYGGPGCGANATSNYPGGGAGEGVVRYRVEVSPGDELVLATGLGGMHSVMQNAGRGAHGIGFIEWEE